MRFSGQWDGKCYIIWKRLTNIANAYLETKMKSFYFLNSNYKFSSASLLGGMSLKE